MSLKELEPALRLAVFLSPVVLGGSVVAKRGSGTVHEAALVVAVPLVAYILGVGWRARRRDRRALPPDR